MWLAIAYKALAVASQFFGLVSWAERLYDAHRQRIAILTEKQNTDLKAQAAAQAKMTQANADAPKTDAEVDDILKNGKL